MSDAPENDAGSQAAPFAALLDHAMALHRQGDLPAAQKHFEEILAADGAHFGAMHQLGILHLQRGETAKAAELLNRAIAEYPGSAAARCDLATAWNVLSRHDEAIAGYENALTIDPDLAEAHYGLGTAFLALARIDEAISCLQRAIFTDPDYAEAHCALAMALRLTKKGGEAIRHCRSALAIDPDYAEAHFALASCCLDAKRPDDAISHSRTAISLRPDYAEAYNCLGLALDASNRPAEALACFAHALAIRPGYMEALVNRGAALQVTGEIDQARDAFRQACGLEPRRAKHYFRLANTARMSADDPYLETMKELALDMSALEEQEQVQLHFALGKALSDVGDHDMSFSHLCQGNNLKRARLAYDEVGTLALFDRIRAVFTPEMMQAREGYGHSSAVPIFIVGMPRSGSTLVEQILSTHPAVFGGGEREDLRAAIQEVGADGGAVAFPDTMRALPADRFRELGASYLKRIQTNAAQAGSQPTRITDKTLMHANLLGLIRLALPNAHVIHIRRDAVDTCLSCYSKLFEDELPFTYDLAELGRYYRAHSALMDYWDNVLPAHWVLHVQYQALVEDFESQARRILAHCGLEWDNACLAFHRNKRTVRTASAVQVRQPLYRSAIDRWRPQDPLLAPLLVNLGPSKGVTGELHLP
ncbi:MAG: sulfotransferase [Alphaproteobacteria bacterium]|nr:sulfotransferase [Alphaproteobacteria bacterium]